MTTASPMPDVLRLVLDTSLFTNPDTARQWGEGARAALEGFVAQAKDRRGRLECYMPPLVCDELKTFVGDSAMPGDFELVVQLKSPNRYRIEVPGFLLYELIDDIRGRIDRGLRVAEKAVRDTHPTNVDRTIARLREQYRSVLRSGLLDSKEDVDLILLAQELDAALISSDRGVVTWAEKLGIRLIHPDKLRGLLDELG
ncbi:MAG: RNA ligase partner protein [Myxococcota bacterium]